MRPTTRHTHVQLPAGLLLVDRPPKGFELDAADLLRLPDDVDDDTARQLVDTHRDLAARGALCEHTVGLVIQVWATRRIPPHQLARDIARGRPANLTRRVKLWEPHRVLPDRRPGPILGRHDRIEQAVGQLLRA